MLEKTSSQYGKFKDKLKAKGRKGNPNCQKLTEELVQASAVGVQENVGADTGSRSWEVGFLIHTGI